MKFFTLAWWIGTQQGPQDDPGGAYFDHVESIRGRLPPGPSKLLALPLHDAQLREFVFRTGESTLRLRFVSYAGDEELVLVYRHVESVESTADPAVGLSGPFGYGDMGYDEVDITADGGLEHRLLFSSGIELVIRFRDFELSRGSAGGG